MKLVYKITLTLILPLVLTLGLWGWFSYRTMSRKIHADTDLILPISGFNVKLQRTRPKTSDIAIARPARLVFLKISITTARMIQKIPALPRDVITGINLSRNPH